MQRREFFEVVTAAAGAPLAGNAARHLAGSGHQPRRRRGCPGEGT